MTAGSFLTQIHQGWEQYGGEHWSLYAKIRTKSATRKSINRNSGIWGDEAAETARVKGKSQNFPPQGCINIANQLVQNNLLILKINAPSQSSSETEKLWLEEDGVFC